MGEQSAGAIERSVGVLLARHSRLVVALSGGADSSVLLDAIARLRSPRHYVVVACVDHGTGEAATEATARAVAMAAMLAFPAVSERLDLARHDEASLRAGRWAFLRRVSEMQGAPIVTAHSLDDHVETVVMRILRGASARGLAGLFAPSDIERPLLEHSRAAIREYAAARQVPFVEDPTNASRRYLRNRIRLDLLPAIRAVHPEFEKEIVRLSRAAAALRQEVDQLAERFTAVSVRGALVNIDANALRELPESSHHLLLPALVARGGIALDRRGLQRLSQMVRSRAGSRGQVSGGFEAVRTRDALMIRHRSEMEAGQFMLRATGETRFADFRFRAQSAASIPSGTGSHGGAWRIDIPRSQQLVIRQWHPGDRLTIDMSGSRRRVKRFFADAGIIGPLRIGWPVVLCGDQVVWIPGIKASQDAIRKEKRMVRYTCERIRE